MGDGFEVFEEGANRHAIGDDKCETGWCGCEGYPKKCVKCDGLVHAEIINETFDGIQLQTKCDKCGDIGFGN